MTEYLYTRPTFLKIDDGLLVNLRYIKNIRKVGTMRIEIEVDSDGRKFYTVQYPSPKVRDMMFEGFIQSIGKREINNNNNE